MPNRDTAAQSEHDRLHLERVEWLERTEGALVALLSTHPDGYRVPVHRHSRAQLLYAVNGVVMVVTEVGRWMVPPDHAMWIPAWIDHSVEILGDVHMHSIYAQPDALKSAPPEPRAVAVPLWLLATSMVVLGTIMPFWLVLAAIRHIGAAGASIVGMTEPFIASLVAWVVLGEILAPVQILGGVVILSGVIVAERARG